MSIGDPRFFARSGPHSLATVAEVAGGTAPEVDLLLTGVAPLQTARQNEVSFLDNRRYAAALEATSAGAVILHPDMIARVPSGVVPIVTPNPYEGWARVASLFHPEAPRESGIHPTYILLHSSMSEHGSMPRPRSGHSPWWQPGPRSVHAAGSDPTPPSARAS
jgi:UDP-3-O-[3-hydroxymyristoyl] glucosamine N-acyltransferase